MRRPVAPALAVALAALPYLPALPAHAALPPLIPRAALFANAGQRQPSLSPDGTRIAYLKRGADGEMNVWLRSRRGDDERQVTRVEKGVMLYMWAGDGRHLLIPMDKDGNEDWHLWAADIDSGTLRDLTPFPGARAENPMVDPAHPDEVLVSVNARDPRVSDLYRVRLSSGEATLDTRNPGDVVAWVPDRDFVVRAAVALDPATANTILRVRDSAAAPWRDLATWDFLEAGSDRSQRVLGFTADGGLLVHTFQGSNTSRLAVLDPADGHERSTLPAHPRADLWEAYDPTLPYAPVVVLRHPGTGAVQAWAVNDLRVEWQVADPSVRADLDALARLQRGDFRVEDRSRDDRTWLVAFAPDDAPGTYWLWDRDRRRGTRLFTTRPDLARWTFARQQGIRIPARDGLEIPCYLTLPPGVPAKGLPLVLVIHGGPWFRDEWGYDAGVQWLANRGYAVLQVNYRGSTGFGKAYLNASNGQMGRGGMQHDLTDAVRWAVARGIADPRRVAITGGSYGGYATLAGLAFTPELYACGVDQVGPSDLRALIESFPAYWAPRRMRWIRRIGDVVANDSLNRALSPLYHAEAIRAPLYISHGANDPRVKLANSEAIVKALRERGREVEFIVYTDEGHGLNRPENAMDETARIERFLARHLGGRAEPWAPVPGSSGQER